jgi:hypothetical protein
VRTVAVPASAATSTSCSLLLLLLCVIWFVVAETDEVVASPPRALRRRSSGRWCVYTARLQLFQVGGPTSFALLAPCAAPRCSAVITAPTASGNKASVSKTQSHEATPFFIS